MKTFINWLTAFAILLTIAVFVSDAFAAPKKITVLIYHVKHEESLEKDRTRMVVNKAIRIIESQMDNINLVPTILYNQPFKFQNELYQNNENTLWDKYSDWLVKKFPDYDIRHALLPPIHTDDGRWYQYGIRTASCPFSLWSPNGGGGISAAYETSFNGLPAIDRSIHVLAHELLHQLGASHVYALPATLMHPGTGSWEEDANANRISSRTKSQVNKCLLGVFGGDF